MKTKRDHINELKVKLKDNEKDELERVIKIEKYEKGEIIMMGAFEDGNVWKVLQGKTKGTLYLPNGLEYYGEFNTEEWMGITACLRNGEATIDVEAIENTTLMSIPLKKIMNSELEDMPALWKLIAMKSTEEIIKFLGGSISKALLSNEDYFMKYIVNNDYKITFTNTRELSELLNMNLRTLQRIMKKLKERKLIVKTKNEIEVVNIKEFDRIIEEKEELF